jgi:hypothetical protein
MGYTGKLSSGALSKKKKKLKNANKNQKKKGVLVHSVPQTYKNTNFGR